MLSNNDQRVQVACKFNKVCMKKKHKTIFTHAIKYANDMNITLNIDDESFNVCFKANDNVIKTQNLAVIKKEVVRQRSDNAIQNVVKSKWQGVNYNTRWSDTSLQPGCFDFLKKWKGAPTIVVRDTSNLYCQTLKTKTFTKIRSEHHPNDTICRLCNNGNETVKPILKRCEVLVTHTYLDRHNLVLKSFVFAVLNLRKFVEICPPWFTQTNVKQFYENEIACLRWDLPENSGRCRRRSII